MKILGKNNLAEQIAQRLSQCWKKRTGLTPTVFLVAVFLFVIGGTAFGGYTTTQLTNDNYAIYGSGINAGGEVIWRTGGYNDTEIFLHSGGATTQISDNNANWSMSPVIRINDNGQVVWMGSSDGQDDEIFLYSGGATAQLTDNTRPDYFPWINTSGQVVWTGFDAEFPNDPEIFLYSDGSTVQLTHNGYGDEYPKINGRGQVVWTGYDGADWEIFLYSGGVTAQLTENGYGDESPQINDSGQVVWAGYADGADSEIFLYSDGITTQLTDDGYGDWVPQINDIGQIVWVGSDSFGIEGGEIFLASPCTDGKPSLTVSRTKVYWASYADYQARALSVDYQVTNAGSDLAQGIGITGSTATNGVSLLTAMPVSEGDLGAGASSTSTLRYTLPAGVTSFRATVNAKAQDACGNSYMFP